ncbi:hypothetical protein P692DRAFT_20103985, partial [Suillus brevipes Sb2]
MYKVSNELSAIWAARFANTSSSSVVCSDSRTPHTRRISCLRNLYRVSSYFSAGYERLCWLLDFRIIHSVQVQVSGSLTSSSDTTRNGFVYINVALNILRSRHMFNKYHDGSSPGAVNVISNFNLCSNAHSPSAPSTIGIP